MSKQQSKSKAAVRKRGLAEIIGGAALAAIGGIASMVSYNNAKAGQTYTVYTGIIALGVVYAIKGIYDVAFPAGFGKKDIDTDNTPKVAEKAEDTKVVEEED